MKSNNVLKAIEIIKQLPQFGITPNIKEYENAVQLHAEQKKQKKRDVIAGANSTP